MSKITPEIIEEKTRLVRDFLKGLTDLRPGNGVKASAMIQGLSQFNTIRNAGCHASFNPIPNPIVIGSGFFPHKEEMPLAEKFWNWVTDVNASPWRSLMVNGIELVYGSDDLPVGWILPYETTSTTRFYFQKNFCILTRVFTEKRANFKAWGTLVDKGMDRADALYLASSIQKADKGDFYQPCSLGNLSGAHWPLTDYEGHRIPKMIDFDIFRSGQIVDNDSIPGEKGYMTGARDKINGYFQSKEKSKRTNVFNPQERCKLKMLQGRFSSQSSYELDDVIENFYKWQKEVGIYNDQRS